MEQQPQKLYHIEYYEENFPYNSSVKLYALSLFNAKMNFKAMYPEGNIVNIRELF